MKHAYSLLLIASIFVMRTLPAIADIKVTLRPLDPAIETANPWFSIRIGYARHGLHHDIGHTVDMRVIKAGAATRIPVNFYNPLFFARTHVQLYHPAFISVGESVEKMPSLLRTVSFGPFDLKSWRSVIDSRIPVQKSGPEIHVQNVVDHIFLFTDTYIYEMDRAGKAMNHSVYIPLLKDLLAYTEETAPSQPWSSRSIEELRQKSPAYAARLKATIDGKFKLAYSYLEEAEALLKLTPDQRLQLRFYQEHIFKTKVVYEDTMDDSDRATLQAFVEQQFAERSARRTTSKSTQGRKIWQNPRTGITYSVGYGESYTMRIGKSDEYMPCLRMGLGVDLSTSVPVEIPVVWGQKSKMGNVVSAKFCDEKGQKKLQLIGAENW